MQSLIKRLKEFKLSGMANSIEERIKLANAKKLSYLELLELLFEDEIANRKDNNYKRRYLGAKLPNHKTLEDFDFSFQKSINEIQINTAATCKYIEDKYNLVFIGDSGTGKTHLAISFALKALSKDYKVFFTTVSDMLYSLHISKADNSYHKKLQQLVSYDLLILDELGFKTLPKYSSDDFFNLISKRYEKASTIITTNKNFDSWVEIFEDQVLTKAIVDRVMHHAEVFYIKGISYRTKTIRKDSSGLNNEVQMS